MENHKMSAVHSLLKNSAGRPGHGIRFARERDDIIAACVFSLPA